MNSFENLQQLLRAWAIEGDMRVSLLGILLLGGPKLQTFNESRWVKHTLRALL